MVPRSPLRVGVTLEQCWHAVPGGTARAALDSVEALARHTDVEQVGVAARHRRPPERSWVPAIPVRMLALPRPVLYETWHALRWPSVDRATGPIDVLHATGMAVPPRHQPLVVTVHDLGFLHERTRATRHGQRFFERSIELARRDADLVIAPSQATIDDCVAHGFDAERLRLVPWGIDPQPASAAAVEAIRRRYDLDRPFVLWVGTIEPRKNLPALVRAFARLARPDLDLVLAGPEGWHEDLDALVAAVPGRVRPIGFVAAADLGPLYAACTVFCYPSLLEGFGLPVLEAMAQGAVVVTSSGTSTAEVAGDAGLLADPRSDEDLVDALRRSLDDDVIRRDLATRSRARAAELSWARTAERLAAVYHEAVEVAR